MLGGGGHFRRQKDVGLLGSERRYDRYRWSSSLWISIESLSRATLAVLMIAARSNVRVGGLGVMCGESPGMRCL